nr:MAG TPA: hypothetical protein [Caudoviricetes sp.]
MARLATAVRPPAIAIASAMCAFSSMPQAYYLK